MRIGVSTNKCHWDSPMVLGAIGLSEVGCQRNI